MDNRITYHLWGRQALFTDPITRIGGEKCSYHIPTYQALKGITESIYWKPTLAWIIEKVRVMKPIQTQTMGVKPMKYNKGGENDLAIYTYLADVDYQVSARFVWNEQREDLAHDRNEHKHFQIATRMLERGGKRDVFLGTRECGGYVEPCIFGEGEGAYDDIPQIGFGIMFHGYDYPSETGEEKLVARLADTTMEHGVVTFLQPQQCALRRELRDMPIERIQTIGAEEVW